MSVINLILVISVCEWQTGSLIEPATKFCVRQIILFVGISVFTLYDISGDKPLGMRYEDIIPFIIEDLVRMVLIFSFPALGL